MWMLIVLWFGLQTPPEVNNGAIVGAYATHQACMEDGQRVISKAAFKKGEEERVRLTCQFAPQQVFKKLASQTPS